MSSSDLLFVYGTLRRGCDTAEARRLHRESTWLDTGTACGRLYRLGWYPALVVDLELAERVTGDVMLMTQPEATFAWLDLYEECAPCFPEPWEYRRELIDVELGGMVLSAWAYRYNRGVGGLVPIPSGDWLCGQDLPSDPVDQPHRHQ